MSQSLVVLALSLSFVALSGCFIRSPKPKHGEVIDEVRLKGTPHSSEIAEGLVDDEFMAAQRELRRRESGWASRWPCCVLE